MKYTRQDYLSDKCNHREYYAQYVDDKIKTRLLQSISMFELLSSKDEHLNDIPLKKWDALSGFVFRGSQLLPGERQIDKIIIQKANELNEGGISPSTMVCIYKEAARQILETVSAK